MRWLCTSSLLANSMVERCRTDDLMPNVPISCLPSSPVGPKVQGLKVIVDCPHRQQWHSDGPPRERYVQGVQRNSAGVTRPSPTLVSRRWCMLRTVSLVVCLVYGMRQIFCRHQVSKTKHRGALLVSWWRPMFHIHIAGLVLCKSCVGTPWCPCIYGTWLFFSQDLPDCHRSFVWVVPYVNSIVHRGQLQLRFGYVDSCKWVLFVKYCFMLLGFVRSCLS